MLPVMLRMSLASLVELVMFRLFCLIVMVGLHLVRKLPTRLYYPNGERILWRPLVVAWVDGRQCDRDLCRSWPVFGRSTIVLASMLWLLPVFDVMLGPSTIVLAFMLRLLPVFEVMLGPVVVMFTCMFVVRMPFPSNIEVLVFNEFSVVVIPSVAVFNCLYLALLMNNRAVTAKAPGRWDVRLSWWNLESWAELERFAVEYWAVCLSWRDHHRSRAEFDGFAVNFEAFRDVHYLHFFFDGVEEVDQFTSAILVFVEISIRAVEVRLVVGRSNLFGVAVVSMVIVVSIIVVLWL